MIRPRYPALVSLLALATGACAPHEAPHARYQPPAAQQEAEREFLSEAQARRARYYWSDESLAPYGVEPIHPDERTSGT